MAEKKTMDMFEFYSGTYKSWQDIFNSYSKMITGFPPAYKGVDLESLFKPFWIYTEDSNKLYKGFTDMTKTMPLPLQAMKEVSEAVANGIDSYVTLYNAWLKVTDRIAREGYEIGRRLGAGEEANTDDFFGAMTDAYQDLVASALSTLKDPMFTGLKDISKAVRRSFGSFPEEQQTARAFGQELLNFYVRTITLSTSAMKEATKTFGDMLGKGTISDNGYQNMVHAYGEMLQHLIETLQVPAVLHPGNKEITNDATTWAKASLDLATSWIEMYLNLYQGIAQSAGETYKDAEKLFKERQISSPDEFSRQWTEACKKTMDTLVKNRPFSGGVPKFVDSYTEWLKTTCKLSRGVMTPPYATKADVDKVSAKLEKLKISMAKTAATAAKTKLKPKEA